MCGYHGVVCRLVVSSLTYFNPMRIMPGFIKEVSWTNTVPGAPGAVLHLFALKVSCLH